MVAVRMVASPWPPQKAFGADQTGSCSKGGLGPLAQAQIGRGPVRQHADRPWSGPQPAITATSHPVDSHSVCRGGMGVEHADACRHTFPERHAPLLPHLITPLK